jgi:MtaA/CmuA family methyltransferase
MTGRERILATLNGHPADHLALMPITMMFAADQIGVPYGRYAADYRVLVEGQIRVAERFGLDYVSAISDPAREAADCGARVAYFDDQPPALVEEEALLADTRALARLRPPDPHGGGRMHDRVRGLALLAEKAGQDLFVEGWIEGPCAEGADLRGINALMLDFVDDPPFVRDLFEFALETGLRFARAQVEAGCDLIGVGDAAASLVGPQVYETFVWPYEKRLVDGLHAMGTRVRLHVCGNTRAILDRIGQLGCEIVDVDFPVPMAEARRDMSPRQVLLGNLNPVAVLKNQTPGAVARAVGACHAEAGARYIVGAGCEVPRGTPAENVLAMRDYARDHKP